MRSNGSAGSGKFQPATGQDSLSQGNGGHRRGFIAVVGIGPGDSGSLTPAARLAIEQAETVVGYHAYLELVSGLIAGKQIVGSGMMQEIDRCAAAIKLAADGGSVAVVSSGDPGIYGMAGLVLELALKLPEENRPELRVIPGVSAVSAAAAALGAPLMHDFAVISLSDLMTPWEVIEKRVRAAAEADFVLAIYNPKSTKRTQHIEKVREICLQSRPGSTPVGVVHAATREDENILVTTLDTFTEAKIDMFTTVIIGNSQTFCHGSFMVTPRGYRL